MFAAYLINVYFVYSVPVSAFLSLGKSEDTLSFVIDYGGDWLNAAIRYISSLLVKGLSNRIELLACKLHVPTQVNIIKILEILYVKIVNICWTASRDVVSILLCLCSGL